MRRGKFTGGDRFLGEILGKTRGEFLLLVLIEPLHELAEPGDARSKCPAWACAMVMTICAMRLDGAVGVGLDVLAREVFGFAPPIVLDRLVEERRVGLVTIGGRGGFPEVFDQLLDERPVVFGLDLGDTRRGLGAAGRGAQARSLRPPRRTRRFAVSRH